MLSLRDPANKTKYHDDDEMWDKAENALREVMNSLGIEYTEEIGEAAFYGPKLDVNVKPAVGNEYTLSTCQLDFCLPAKFELTYVDKDGEKKTPVVLHRAILGSLDRFMAYILEETMKSVMYLKHIMSDMSLMTGQRRWDTASGRDRFRKFRISL